MVSVFCQRNLIAEIPNRVVMQRKLKKEGLEEPAMKSLASQKAAAEAAEDPDMITGIRHLIGGKCKRRWISA
jgi:hypothetical protein